MLNIIILIIIIQSIFIILYANSIIDILEEFNFKNISLNS